MQVISSIDEFQKFLASSNTALDETIGSEKVGIGPLLFKNSYCDSNDAHAIHCRELLQHSLYMKASASITLKVPDLAPTGAASLLF